MGVPSGFVIILEERHGSCRALMLTAMPLPVIPGVVRCTVGGQCTGGGRWANTWHLRLISLVDPTVTQLVVAQNFMQTFYSSQVMPKCAAATTLDSLGMTPLDGTSGAVAFTLNVAGSGIGVPLPAETSLVLSLKTGGRGRRARGRVYLPPFTTDAVAPDGHATVGVVGSLLTGFEADRGGLTSGGWEIGVASYGRSVKVNHTTSPKTYAVTTWPPFFSPLTAASIDTSYDVIRGRKR